MHNKFIVVKEKEKGYITERKLYDIAFYNVCRDYWTRTSDLAPPRRVRYQLRQIPNLRLQRYILMVD